MSALYVSEVVLIVVAVAGMFWLKRESDRYWRLYCATRSIAAKWLQFKIEIGDRLTPALREAAAAAAAMQPQFDRLGKAMREVGKR